MATAKNKGIKTTLKVVPTGDALGADLLGVHFDRLTEQDYAVIRQAWRDHLVLRIGGSAIDEGGFLDFTRQFGQPMMAPAYPVAKKKSQRTQTPITYVTNIRDDQGRPLGALGADALAWHSDMAYSEAPPVHTLLHALEIPESGGNTSFLNMYMLYEALSPSLQRLADNLIVCHPPVENTTDAEQPNATSHPMVQLNPETERKALFLGRRSRASLEGIPRDEAEDILDRLWAYTNQSKFAWTQRWRSGDLVMWDNRYVMHRRDAFDDNTSRLLRRVTLSADAVSL